MQSASSRIWTRVTVSFSYDDNHYTTGTTYVNGNMLTPSTTHVLLKISIHLCRSIPKKYHLSWSNPKNSTATFNSVPQLTFKNPQIVWTISSGHDVINPLNSLQRPSSPISCLGVLYDRWGLSYPFCAGVRLWQLTMLLNKRHRVVQNLTKVNDRILSTKND